MGLSLSNPVQNPNLPYVAPISGRLREGMALYLQGVVPANADRFELNFKTGPSDNDDIAFDFNPRMDQKVVMNSFRNGGWEAEESVSDNPFKKGQPFEMFTVYVNGKELHTFKHRIPLEKVSTLNISGDVHYTSINQPGPTLYQPKPAWTSLESMPVYAGFFSREMRMTRQNLPYVGQISGGLKEGMALYLQGVFPTNADQFELNFKTGPSDNDDIAFHFNPRMDQKVVMNSFRNGGWEAEESVSDNPFIKGQPFEMFIVVKSEGYVVYVNGKELCTFKHRIPLEKVDPMLFWTPLTFNVMIK
uniref:Galectin n=1 Tax=Sinocyclocheilus grahami TaxID=75366 RepID=A0A672N0H7_SINGR